MPARAQMVDQINEKIRQGITKELLELVCCVGHCKEVPVSALTVRLRRSNKDIMTDVFMLCKLHKDVIKASNPQLSGKELKQGVGLY